MVCGKNITVEIDATGHTEGEFKTEVKPTCLNKGVAVKRCTICNVELSRKDIPATGHNWDATKYKWSKDNTMCYASRSCSNDSSHTENESVEAEVKTTNANCTENGKSVYTAKFKNNDFVTQKKEVTLDKLGHDWGNVQYTWSDDGSMCTAKRVCTRDSSHIESETASISSGTITSKETKVATCTEKGETTYTASFSNKDFANATKTIIDIDKKPHTEVNGGSADCHKKCSVCGATLSSEHKFTDSILVNSTCILKGVLKHTCDCGYSYTSDIDYADHVYSNEFTVDVPATCEGVGSKSRHCTVPGCNAKTDVTVIPATGHSGDKGNGTVTKKATCEEAGTQKMVCEVCGKEYKEKVIPATGHNYSNDFTVDKEATCTEAGHKSKHCTNSGCIAVTDERDIDVLGHELEVTYEWNTAIGLYCKAHWSCVRCDFTYDQDPEIISSKETAEPTCEGKGKVVFTANFGNPKDGSGVYETTSTNIVEEPELGHDWKPEISYVWASGKDALGNTVYTGCTATRTCSRDSSHTETEEGVISSTLIEPSTCGSEGSKIYRARFNNFGETVSKTVTLKIDELKHTYSRGYIGVKSNSTTSAELVNYCDNYGTEGHEGCNGGMKALCTVKKQSGTKVSTAYYTGYYAGNAIFLDSINWTALDRVVYSGETTYEAEAGNFLAEVKKRGYNQVYIPYIIYDSGEYQPTLDGFYDNGESFGFRYYRDISKK